MNRKSTTILLLIACSIFPIVLNAQEYNSSSYKVLDPVIAPSGYSTSASFKLWSTIAELATGTSTSALYNLGSGFLRFPLASSPTVSATAGDASVQLSWTVSNGVSGWTTSGYSIGQSTVSGGPYTYTSVGNVLSSNRTGLTNLTNYYFVVVAKDVFGNHIATSTQISATPVAATSGGSSGGGGGGGGGSTTAGDSATAVLITGRAYPLSKVNVLKDGKIVLTTIAGPDSNFSARLTNISSGNYTFGVYGEDKNQVKSNLFTFPIFITSGVETRIGGVFISPTISVDKLEVKKGENIVIFGQSVPSADVVINVNSEQEHFVTRKSDKDGIYLLNFDTSVLELGQHHTKSKAVLPTEISDFSRVVGFIVGNRNVLVDAKKCTIRGDLNGDCRVNLVDFSIAAYWYLKPGVVTNADINNDKRVDLIDFSIMAFNWTG